MHTRKHMVVLTGAGISAESGLKTFRDSDGLWNGYNVFDVATPGAWQRNPDLVLDFYNQRRRDVAAASPNAAHLALAELEKEYDVTIVTQNIDDLHERAGSTRIIHLHGEIFKMRSERNETKTYPILGDMLPGALAEDGGRLRPHIVWFEEPVPLMDKAIALMHDCDLFVIIGTSLQVYPAASLVHYAPHFLPVYLIDRKIPDTDLPKNCRSIEMPATEGVGELIRLLKKS